MKEALRASLDRARWQVGSRPRRPGNDVPHGFDQRLMIVVELGDEGVESGLPEIEFRTVVRHVLPYNVCALQHHIECRCLLHVVEDTRAGYLVFGQAGQLGQIDPHHRHLHERSFRHREATSERFRYRGPVEGYHLRSRPVSSLNFNRCRRAVPARRRFSSNLALKFAERSVGQQRAFER